MICLQNLSEVALHYFANKFYEKYIQNSNARGLIGQVIEVQQRFHKDFSQEWAKFSLN